MGISSEEPDPGRKEEVRRWHYESVANGQTVTGFLAGHPFGAHVHFLQRYSKPCRARMSKGALPCALCSIGQPEWRGYVPWFSAEYRRCFTLIPAELLDAVREIEPYSQVKITREKPKKSPAIFRAQLWRTTPFPDHLRERDPVHLLPFLLRLWKDEELLYWHVTGRARPAAPASVGVDMPTPPVLTPAETTARAVEIIRGNLTWPGKDEPGAKGPELLGDILDHKPDENGKRKRR